LSISIFSQGLPIFQCALVISSTVHIPPFVGTCGRLK
jgi:hypothetical protein